MMDEIIKYLESKGGIGINPHEKNANQIGYLKDYLNNYLPLKESIFKKLEKVKDDNQIRYLNAIRIYSYSIFENLWFGYLMAYSKSGTFKFIIDNKEIEISPGNSYKNHLPSFSSAILNFGTIRDYFLVLLQISINPNFATSTSKLKEAVTVRYSLRNIVKFELDIKNLSQNPNYMKNAIKILKFNEFRNFYAHRLRLIWWTNPNSVDFCFKKDLIDSINSEGDDAKDRWSNHLLDIFLDARKYEKEIENSRINDLVCSGKILKDTHNELAVFINKTFRFIKDKIK